MLQSNGQEVLDTETNLLWLYDWGHFNGDAYFWSWTRDWAASLTVGGAAAGDTDGCACRADDGRDDRGRWTWLALVLALASLVQRPWRPRALVGLVAFPLVYGLAGAVYHGDLLWMLHWPPALAAPMEDNPFWQAQHGEASLPTIVAALLAITPAVALLGTWRWSSATAVERAGLSFAIAFVAALVLLPRWRVFNFDLSPRYLLPVLPWLALASSAVATVGGAVWLYRRAIGRGAA